MAATQYQNEEGRGELLTAELACAGWWCFVCRGRFLFKLTAAHPRLSKIVNRARCTSDTSTKSSANCPPLRRTDSLDDLFSRLDAATFESIPRKSPMRSRPPTQPPPRRSSPSSSRSRLSTQSSSRSIHSLASAHGSITASLSVGDWPREVVGIRSALSGAGAALNPYEGVDDASTPSPPELLPRPSPSPFTRTSSSQNASTTLIRLVPRSARSERTPREELASLRDLIAGGSGSEDEDWGVGEEQSVHSRDSRGSYRAKREADLAAAEVRIRTSREALERGSLDRRGEGGEGEESETRSFVSAGSAPSGYGAGGIWPQATASSAGSVGGGSSIGRESPRGDRERERERPRQRELREWSQACWVWTREKGGGGSGMLSRAPLIREVSFDFRIMGRSRAGPAAESYFGRFRRR